MCCELFISFFLFNNTATTEIYTYGHTLSLHDALPIWRERPNRFGAPVPIMTSRETLSGCATATFRATNEPIEWPISVAFSMPSRSEEHTSELQSLMRISYAVFCLKKKQQNKQYYTIQITINKHYTK